MKYRKLIWIIILLRGSAALAEANSPEHFGVSFQRGLDYYKWGSNSFKTVSLRGERFYGSGDFYVMLRQPPGFPDQWKTSVKVFADWEKPVWSKYRLSGNVMTEYFADEEVDQSPPTLLNNYYPNSPEYHDIFSGLTTGLNNKTVRQSATVGIDLIEFMDLEIKTSAGIYGEEIQQSAAVGPTGNIEMSGERIDVGGFLTDIDASAYGQFLEDRTNREINANFRAWKEYSKSASNLFSCRFRNYVREFPLVNSGTIDRRFEEEYRIGNLLEYKLLGQMGMTLDLSLAQRRVEPSSASSNNLTEISTGMAVGLKGDFPAHRAMMSFSSAGQNQSYPSREVKGRQYRLDAEDNFTFLHDSIQVSGMISRNSFDVLPELLSIDTRDELRHSYRIIHTHKFDDKLELETQLRTDLYHLVYLKAERSADNNWERFFLFSPEVRYTSVKWSNKAKFRVSADYIDYDFEESLPPSRVFRKYSAEDSLYIRISSDWALKIQYLLLLEDQGNLDWAAFVQDLSDKYTTNDLNFLIIRKIDKLDLGIGWSIYHRVSYHVNSSGDLEKSSTVTSTSPVISLTGVGPYGTIIELNTNYRRIQETGRSSYYQTLIDFTLLKIF